MMTSREFFNAVIAHTTDAELLEYAHAQLEKLDEKAKKSAEKRAEGSKAREIVAEKVVDLMSNLEQSVTVAELFDMCLAHNIEVKSPQALTYILTKLRENGNVAREVIKKKAYYSVTTE